MAFLTRDSLTRAGTAVAARVPRWGFETLALVFLVLCGWGVLIGLDAVLRTGLWGEWTFAMIGCSLGIWLLARFTASRLPQRFMFEPPRLWQAPIWAAVPLVGVPFAALTMPWGTVVFVGVLIGLLLALRWLSWAPPSLLRPIQWVAAFAAVIAVTAFVATGTATDTGEPAAATPPVPGAMALAWRYRPLLFFDSRERFFPMNIVAEMKNGRVAQCRYAVRENDCQDVASPAQLDTSYDFLSIQGGSLGPQQDTGGQQSSYYVHGVKRGGDIFLDYWWYYAQNPLPIAKRIFCGPGLRAPEISCFEHPADWEGLTVVLAPCGSSEEVESQCHESEAGQFRIVGVDYAEHRNVKHFLWNNLKRRWTQRDIAAADNERPVAFVALDSHASYPFPCSSSCGVESHYNGRLAWGNNGAECGNSCLEALPTTSAGAPATWNAFPGHWGKQTCILLGAYCDVGPAPRAPAFQGRYKHPWSAT